MIKTGGIRKHITNVTIALAAVCAIFPGSGRCSDVTGVTFVRIARTGDDPPGKTGPLTGFDIVGFGSPIIGNAPAIDETGRVAFVGRDTSIPWEQSGANAGIFVGSGAAIGTAADRTLDPPGLTGPLVEFQSPALSPFGVVFSGYDASFRSAVISNVSGIFTFKVIAQYLDLVPGSGTDTFNGVGNPTISGQYVAFLGDFPAGVGSKSGIFVGQTETSSASLIPQVFPIAITGDDPPGPVGPFRLFMPVFANRGVQTAFLGCDASYDCGVFIGSYTPTVPGRPVHRTFNTVVSIGDILPSGSGSLLIPTSLAYDGTQVTFGAISTMSDGTDASGLYTANLASHAITKIIRQGDALPGAVGAVGNTGLNAAISDAHYIAFWAGGAAGGQGVYVSIGGNLRKIVDTSDPLDGKTISNITFGANGAALNSLAFGVQFSDGSQGIYRADLTIQQ